VRRTDGVGRVPPSVVDDEKNGVGRVPPSMVSEKEWPVPESGVGGGRCLYVCGVASDVLCMRILLGATQRQGNGCSLEGSGRSLSDGRAGKCVYVWSEHESFFSEEKVFIDR